MTQRIVAALLGASSISSAATLGAAVDLETTEGVPLMLVGPTGFTLAEGLGTADAPEAGGAPGFGAAGLTPEAGAAGAPGFGAEPGTGTFGGIETAPCGWTSPGGTGSAGAVGGFGAETTEG